MEHSFDGQTTPTPVPATFRPFPKSPAISVRGETLSLKGSLNNFGRDPSKPMDLQRNGTVTNAISTTGNTSAVPKPRRLRNPRATYPMEYDRRMRDMEHWDNLHFRRAAGRCTWIRPEDIPPQAVILDIGCGYGSWAIMTAREHQSCRVFGFDSAEIQPDLKRVGLSDVAERIVWVHGDMLEVLPFPDAYFDVVRANSIEFCVPEHKWAVLFQEIDRVLKPGGAFETSQGGMIIPCPRFAPRPPPQNGHHSRTSAGSTKTQASDELANADPRDHSKIKAAFNAMLEVRFLNPKITTIIPFYMNLHFTNVLMSPTLRIMLPPSTFVRGNDEVPDGKAAEPQTVTDQLSSLPFTLQTEQHAENSEVVITQGGQMHLTYTMNTVLACREAIWEQFEALNPALARADFDGLIKNWELDMRDRIDMRGTLKAGLGWNLPADSERDEGYRKTWRETMVQLHENEGPWDAQPLPEACREIRAFTGYKPRV